MSLNECASCHHTNPANAKFCNACGAALSPPAWAGPSAGGFMLAARSERSAAESGSLAAAAASLSQIAVPAATDPLAEPQEPIAYSVQFDPDQTVRIGCVYGTDGLPAANSDFGPAGVESHHPGLDAQFPVAHAAESTTQAVDMTAPDGALPVSGDISLVRRAWQRQPAAVLVGLATLAALAALVYVGYQQQSAVDIFGPATADGAVSGRPESADPGTPVRRGTGAVADGLPLPLPAADPAVPPRLTAETVPVLGAGPHKETQGQSQVSLTPAGGGSPQDAGPGGAQKQPKGDDARAAADIAVAPPVGRPAPLLAAAPVGAVPRSRTRAAIVNPPEINRRAAGSPEAAAAVTAAMARTANQSSIANAAQPPRIGPCTEAVAALGLCTPDSTQRKQ